VVLGAACAHAPAPSPDAAWPKAPSPAAARARAAAAADPLTAVDLAWVLGNDRAAATRRAERALAATGTAAVDARTRAALAVRLAFLRSAALDVRGRMGVLLDAIEAAPSAPEAELAADLVADLVVLEVSGDRHLAKPGLLARLEAALARAARPGVAWALAQAIQRLEPTTIARPALVARSGHLTQVDVIGPLGPAHPIVLRAPTPLELRPFDPPPPMSGGLPTPTRRVEAHDLSLALSDDTSGTFLVRARVETRAAPRAVLGVWMAGLGRVRVDGVEVFARDTRGAEAPQGVEIPLALDAGAHVVTVLTTAGAGGGIQLALLDADGAPILTEPTNPPALALSGAPAPTTTRLRADAVAPLDAPLLGLPHATALLRSAWALRFRHRDLTRARAALLPAAITATRAAALVIQDARVGAAEGLPESRTLLRLRQALREDPTHARVAFELAEALVDVDADEAEQLAERARAAAPGAIEPDLVLYGVARARRLPERMEAALARALTKGETNATLDAAIRFHRSELRLHEVARLEARRQAVARTAEQALARAIDAPDDDAETKAVEATASDSPTPEVQLARAATAWAARGDHARARRLLDEAKRRAPTSRSVLRAIVEVEGWGGPGVPEAIDGLRRLGDANLALEGWVARHEGRTVGVPRGLEAALAIDAPALAAAPLPERWAEAERVRLLDRVVDEVLPSGGVVTQRHAIVRLQTKEATDQVGEIQLPDGALTLALRTLKPDGSTLEVDRHAGKDDLSYSGLAPGDSVEERWVAVEGPATMFGGYQRRFFFRTDVPSRRSELVVVVPKPARAEWVRYHGAPAPEIVEDATRTIYTWRVEDADGLPIEPASVPYEEFLPFVVVSVGVSSDDALRANLAMAEGLFRSHPTVEALARTLVHGLASPLERYRRILGFVDGHIAHGPGRELAVVLETRRGDRSTLLRAMFAAVGLPVRVWLVRGGAEPRVEPPHPDARRFRRVLLDVDLGPDGRRWLAPSQAELVEGLSSELRGGLAIELAADGRASPIVPIDPALLEDAPLRSTVALVVDEAGAATGTITLSLPPSAGRGLRQGLESLTEDQRRQGLQGYLGAVLPGARLLSEVVTSSKSGAVVLQLGVALDHLFEREDDAWVANAFFGTPLGLRLVGLPTLEAYLGIAARKMPLLLAEARERVEVVVEVPGVTGAPTEAPESFTVTSPFASVTQRFRFEGGRATLSLAQDVPMGRVAVADFPGFRELAQAVSQRSRNRLVLPRARASAP
jgi:hypothetical protein